MVPFCVIVVGGSRISVMTTLRRAAGAPPIIRVSGPAGARASAVSAGITVSDGMIARPAAEAGTITMLPATTVCGSCWRWAVSRSVNRGELLDGDVLPLRSMRMVLTGMSPVAGRDTWARLTGVQEAP